MILVLSHAWCLDAQDHAQQYIAIADEFGSFHTAQPGFRGRGLVRDVENPIHFINLRWWDSLADYEAMVQIPEYAEWIARLSEHVEPRSPQKQVLSLALELEDPAQTPAQTPADTPDS